MAIHDEGGSGPTPTRATSTPPTRACTPARRCRWPSRATPPTSPPRSGPPPIAGCRSSRRGAGTSLAGQTAGQGIVLDTSRHMDEIHEIDVERRRARVGPGVVQDALNRAVKPHGLGFGPDTSTSNRATLGGMIGNNSSGSHSIVYGTTIDHVLSLEVVLSDGSTATFGPVDAPERAPTQDTLEGRILRGLPEILREHERAIAEDYPLHWRQSGGYRLDSLARSFDLAKLVTGSEGTLVADHGGDGEADRAAEGAPVRGRPLRVASTRRSPQPVTRSTLQRGGDRDDRRDDPRALALQARVRADGVHDRGRSGRAAVRDVLRRHARGGRRAARPSSSARGASTATATTSCAPRPPPSRTR